MGQDDDDDEEDSTDLQWDSCPGCVQMSQGQQIHQNLHSIGIHDLLHIPLVQDEFVQKQNKPVSFHSVCTLEE